MKPFHALFLFIIIIFSFYPLKIFAQENNNKMGREKLELFVDSTKDLIGLNNLFHQQAPTFAERDGKGVFIPIIAGYLINKGVEGIQKMISDRKNRYISQYSFAKLDHYFYDQVSTTNAFDPVGLQFKGFKILRVLKNEDGSDDTVFYAKFLVDTTQDRCMEIMNNGIFRLRLDSIMISKTRVRSPKNVKKINVDFEINFTSTYRSDNGQLFAEQPLGKFIFTLRDAPLYHNDPESKSYYDSMDSKKPALTGECFMVPRSYGFYKDEHGGVKVCWGMGLFSINVSVKETSKTKFVDRLIIYSSDPALGIVPPAMQKQYGLTAPTSSSSSGSKSSQQKK